jgi:hypothetical protein
MKMSMDIIWLPTHDLTYCGGLRDINHCVHRTILYGLRPNQHILSYTVRTQYVCVGVAQYRRVWAATGNSAAYYPPPVPLISPIG